MHKLEFFKQNLLDKKVASVIPTSQTAIRKICKGIDFSKRLVIVEYGPGTGVFAKFLLKRMNADSKLILIETNKRFVSLLSNVKDKRVRVFNESAENVKQVLSACGEKSADHIISGIPFSLIPKSTKKRIIERTREALANEGSFLVYQFYSHIKKQLKETFDYVDSKLAVINIPPLFVYQAFKAES